MQSPIEVRSIVKAFGRTVALDRASFTFAKGMNIILGPKAAGKTSPC